MSPDQCRAARALLELTQPALAQLSGVSPSTLRDYEAKRRQPIPNNLAAIRGALESAGVTFLADGEPSVGPGVSMQERL